MLWNGFIECIDEALSLTTVAYPSHVALVLHRYIPCTSGLYTLLLLL